MSSLANVPVFRPEPYSGSVAMTLVVVMALAVVAKEVLAARVRSRPIAEPYWQCAPFAFDRFGQFQDPDTGHWTVIDTEEYVVLARGIHRGKTLQLGVENLKRCARGEAMISEFIR
jgi:hypothetical protein